MLDLCFPPESKWSKSKNSFLSTNTLVIKYLYNPKSVRKKNTMLKDFSGNLFTRQRFSSQLLHSHLVVLPAGGAHVCLEPSDVICFCKKKKCLKWVCLIHMRLRQHTQLSTGWRALMFNCHLVVKGILYSREWRDMEDSVLTLHSSHPTTVLYTGVRALLCWRQHFINNNQISSPEAQTPAALTVTWIESKHVEAFRPVPQTSGLNSTMLLHSQQTSEALHSSDEITLNPFLHISKHA